MISTGPLGDIPGMRWCGESNRYYARLPTHGPATTSSFNTQEFAKISDPEEAVRRTPVTSKVLESLPTARRKRCRLGSDDCAICLKSLLTKDPRTIGNRTVSLPCNHSFHKECNSKWLSSHSGCCPTCRTVVDTSLAVAAASCKFSASSH